MLMDGRPSSLWPPPMTAVAASVPPSPPQGEYRPPPTQPTARNRQSPRPAVDPRREASPDLRDAVRTPCDWLRHHPQQPPGPNRHPPAIHPAYPTATRPVVVLPVPNGRQNNAFPTPAGSAYQTV